MIRVLLSLVLGGALFAFVGWYFDLFAPVDTSATSSGVGGAAKTELNLGNSLYPPVPLQVPIETPPERKIDPVVVLGTMAVIDRPDIPAPIPGQLLFIGDAIPEGAAQVAGLGAFLAEPFYFARVNRGDHETVILYRRLYEGEVVHENQMVGMVDPAKAMGDLDIKRSKAIAAKADVDGAKAIAAEAENKLITATQLKQRNAIADEEYRSALLTKDKMWYDSIGKVKAWDVAKDEANMSLTILKLHEIRNKIPAKVSIIQKIYKQRGEAIKELEPMVVQLNSLDLLMAEAQIEAAYSPRLRKNMLVTIEPSMVDSPPKTYTGHKAAVNCLAVTHDARNPLIVSGGEDRTVLVWNRFVNTYVREFKHPDAVKALATSPPGAPHNLILTGCVDGSIRIFDLDATEKDKVLRKEAKEHSVAITAVAFSPDGSYFATGAADGSIILWKTDKVEVYYPFDEVHGVTDPHRGAVTALHFTPQCTLVSAGADNTLCVWSLKEKGAVLEYEPLSGRTGSVASVGVSADGRELIFDQGKTLQIRAVADGHLINSLRNPGGVIPFETLALFSPDASLLLTAGASEGRLQLWRTPTAAARGYEVRQFATAEHSPVSCAAFAPLTDYNNNGTFAVSGNKDGQIYLWPLPSRAEVDNHPIHDVRVRLINHSLNPSTRQISIGVEIPNPPTPKHPRGRLEPGRPVTIVID